MQTMVMPAVAVKLQLLAGIVREGRYGKGPRHCFEPDRGGDDPEA
jgi:hypothetical protein